MTPRILLLAILAPVAAAAVLRFEVASIKPADRNFRPGHMGASIETSPGMLSTSGSTLRELIAAAYAVETYQVAGGPAWSDSARFAIAAKPPAAASREQLLQMLQPLLADRFQLAFHRETRNLPVYELVVAKSGPKFHRAQPGAEPPRAPVNMLGHNTNLAWFARYLTNFGAGRPVIDKTGLAGNYDLDLNMEPILAQAVSAGEASSGLVAVFQATADVIEDRLGLKLAPAKAPVAMIAIDRAVWPAEN